MAAWPPSGVNWSTILFEKLASAQLSYRLPMEDVPALAAPKLSMIEEMSSPPHSLVVVLRCSLPMLWMIVACFKLIDSFAVLF